MCKIIIISGRVHHECVLAFGEGSTFAGSRPRHQPFQYIIEICDFHLNQKNPKGAPHALVYYIDGVVVKGRIIFATDLFITATQSVTDRHIRTHTKLGSLPMRYSRPARVVPGCVCANIETGRSQYNNAYNDVLYRTAYVVR